MNPYGDEVTERCGCNKIYDKFVFKRWTFLEQIFNMFNALFRPCCASQHTQYTHEARRSHAIESLATIGGISKGGVFKHVHNCISKRVNEKGLIAVIVACSRAVLPFNNPRKLGRRSLAWRGVLGASCGLWSVRRVPRGAADVQGPASRGTHGLVSLNRLSVGCGTTPRRQSGYLIGFCLFIRVIQSLWYLRLMVIYVSVCVPVKRLPGITIITQRSHKIFTILIACGTKPVRCKS